MINVTCPDGEVIELAWHHLIVLGALGWIVIALVGWAFHHTITEALGEIHEQLKRIAKVEEDKWKEWKL